MSTTLRQRASSPAAKGVAEKAQVAREVEAKEVAEGQKFIVPNFTVKQLLDAIPAHCFHRNGWRSSLYIVSDLSAIGACAYLALNMDSLLLNKLSMSGAALTAAKIALWTLYTFVTGLFGTGIWIIGHECGHQAFSSSKTVNNAVGWVLHSFVLVPYHAWRISHGRHHAATGHLTRDEVFVPKTRKMRGIEEPKEEGEVQGINISAFRQNELREALEESPLSTLFNAVLQQLFGFPSYLIRNAAGQKHYPKGTNHFNPEAIIFKPQHRMQIIMSNIGILLNFATLAYWSYQRSFSEMFVMYIIPYLWVNNWLVFITYLQHTDPVLPHYSANKWTFARGALCTIDRNFMGPIGPYIFHGICETHVAHHISSKIPHYHAWEATEALKTFLGPHYMYSNESMFASFWRSFRECIFIEDNEDIVFYKNYAGVAKYIPVEEGGNVSDSGVDMTESK